MTKKAYGPLIGSKTIFIFQDMTTENNNNDDVAADARPMTMEALRSLLNQLHRQGMLASDAQLQLTDGRLLSWFKVVPDDDAPGFARVIWNTL